jgi:hypothetical protein
MVLVDVENPCEHCFFCGFVMHDQFPCTNCTLYALEEPKKPTKKYFLDGKGSSDSHYLLNNIEDVPTEENVREVLEGRVE